MSSDADVESVPELSDTMTVDELVCWLKAKGIPEHFCEVFRGMFLPVTGCFAKFTSYTARISVQIAHLCKACEEEYSLP